MDDTWISLPGAWNGGDCPADPAHGSFLHGDGVLLCKKLRAASSLVSGNAVIQEASGELCGKEDNDFKDLRRIKKDSYYWYQEVIKSNGENL